MNDIKRNEFGPAYMVDVYDPAIGMRGFLVVDNLALGPGKGGIRMTPDVTLEEVFRLARTMTWKNALAGIPFGGAKAGIVWKGGSDELKKKHVQSFAQRIRPFIPKYYIAGPDVNSGEHEMKWFAQAIDMWRAATGKPADFCTPAKQGSAQKCGLPHELGSTGFGVAHAAATAAHLAGIPLNQASVAIEGFGNVGTFAFRFLTQMGARVVAVADSKGAAFYASGLDQNRLQQIKKERGSVKEYPGAQSLSREEIFALDVDILIPAAVTDVIHNENKHTIKARMIVEGANIPMREDIEEELFQRGIIIVPDIIANAGGVISSYAEYKGYSVEKMFALVEHKIKKATQAVMKESITEKRNPRKVAMDIAKKRVSNAITHIRTK